MLNPKRIKVNKQYPLAAQTLSQMFTVKKTEVTVIQFLGNDDMGPSKKGTNSKKNLSYWIPVKKNKVDIITKVKPKATATTFQGSLRATILIGQAFSLIPVVGIMSNKATDVKFSKKSWKVIYSIISFIGQMFMTTMCLYKLIVDTTLKNTTPVIFYGTTFISMVMFFQMGIRWPVLMQHISKAEMMGPNYDSRLTYKCNITCVVVLTSAFLEHILSLLSAFAGALVCHDNLNLYEGFVRHFYPWVFDVLPYSPALGIVTQFLHFQSTFIWNFSDLFVICMSYYLTSCLEEINKKLLDAQGKYLPEIFWRRIREDYGRACQLVRRVDDVISGIIFISFANNLFFICLQLFNTLEDGIKGTGECSSRTAPSNTQLLGGYEAAAYFVFSLVFLISRSVAVSLIASQVNSASNVPAPVLYDVPSPVYCVEVQRFLDQVNGDKVALTGLQFFSVTRGLLLTVAGTIVTYELVMFQFNSPSPTPSSPLNVTSLPFTTSSSSP